MFTGCLDLSLLLKRIYKYAAFPYVTNSSIHFII